MNNYVIGLDLGENNVGWSIYNPATQTIEKKGVRMYSIAKGSSDRRLARDTRRRLKRSENRIEECLKLCSFIGFPSENTIDPNLLEKRKKGLNQKIEPQDIVNILCYFMSHRGYIPFGDEERKLIDLQDKYPCEYYLDLKEKEGKCRALEKVVDHTELQKEMLSLLVCQMKFYPELGKIIGDNESGLIYLFDRKRKFWEGPGSIDSFTPFGRFKNKEDVVEYKSSNQEKYLFEELIGHCKIYPDEKCAPKGNFYAEEFNLLNDFINLQISNIDEVKDPEYITSYKIMNTNNSVYKLSPIALEAITNYCLSYTERTLSYNKVLKDVLGLDKKDITGCRIDKKGSPQFSLMKEYRFIKRTYAEKNLDFTWLEDKNNYNQLLNILAVAPGIVEVQKMLEFTHNFSNKELEAIKIIQNKLKDTGMLEYHALSEKALIRSINDMLNTGLNFMQVSKKFNYEKEAKEKLIKEYGSANGTLLMTTKYVDEIIASPAVKKTLRQAIRVINSIILEKKSYPSVISIESTKEMNGNDRRREIENMQRCQEQLRKNAEQILQNYGVKITDKNIEKVMLYEEINGTCAYCGKPVQLSEVLNGNFEIEHILPISQSGDDSYNNKTIACRECNSRKGNKTPFAFLTSYEFDEMVKRVNKLKIAEDKKYNLMTQEDINKHKIRFFNRSLRDTSYATKELVNQVKMFNDYVQANLNTPVINTLSTPGQLTHKIRMAWQLEKNRDDGKYHHAVDASIVAAIAGTDIGKLIIQSQNDSQYWILNKDKANEVPKLVQSFNMPNMKEEISSIKSDKDISISYQVNKDINRQYANANITKFIKKEDNFFKIQQINNLYAPDLMKNQKKNLDILFDENNSRLTLLCQEQDPKLFHFLQTIYNEHKDDNKNPFLSYCKEKMNEDEKFDVRRHGIKTPSKKSNGVLVTKLRYMQSAEDPYLLNKKNIKKKPTTYIGLDSVSIYCTRLYWDNDLKKIIFMPIYAPVVNPNTGKINEQHTLYKLYYDKFLKDKNVKFIVDLYNGNYIEIEKSNGDVIKEYVKGYAKASSSIQCKSGKYLSSKDKFALYDVDVLGNKVKRLTWPEL